MVGHLRGRQLNPVKIEIYRADVSHRLQRLHECSIGVYMSVCVYVWVWVCGCVCMHMCAGIYMCV
jgi:hypothetical protein